MKRVEPSDELVVEVAPVAVDDEAPTEAEEFVPLEVSEADWLESLADTAADPAGDDERPHTD